VLIDWAFAGEPQKPRETSVNERKRTAFLSVVYAASMDEVLDLLDNTTSVRQITDFHLCLLVVSRT
jgi:hypothetical protein